MASNEHAHLLDNWFSHMDALGVHRVLAVAMDGDLAARLKGVHFRSAQAEFDGTLADFWFQRALIWAFLAEQGIEFIHSDTDAVWLRGPTEAYENDDFDLLLSQGTIHPLEALTAWGFVLCCGFFWARPTPASRRVFRALVAPNAKGPEYDDQTLLNRLLVGAGTTWMANSVESYDLQLRGRSFRCFRQPLTGHCTSLDLHLALLPHHLFPRLPPCAPEARVRHMLWEPHASPEGQISLMRATGCWRLDAYPKGYLLSD
jgi:hypothetical protein